MRTNRVLVPLVVVIPLVLGIDSFLAQSPNQHQRDDLVNQIQITEPDKQTRIRNTLADLLADVGGVHVGGRLPVSDTETYKEIRVRWQSYRTPAQTESANLEQQPTPGVVTLVDSTKRNGTLPRERSVELSTNQILVIALDDNGELRWWKLLLDPRLVRSEAPGATGEISSANYYLAKADFTIAFPDDSSIKELRFYHPLWTGKVFHLELLSTLSVE